MKYSGINGNNTVFVLLSFEGPDPYSLAGGLGVRAANLSSALAQTGSPVHFFFVGDPQRKGEDVSPGGRLTLHRWCQWISRYYPSGVYQGEEEKLYDFNQSIPSFVTEKIIKPAMQQDKMVVVLGEEWHTAEAMCRLSENLRHLGCRDRVVMFWNTNNTFGFHRIDWRRLSNHTSITTVSRYMKHIMQAMGLNPMVVPNGIPRSLLDPVDINASLRLRRELDAGLVLAKIARWDVNKRWSSAVEAAARLKADGLKTVLIARGGIEPYGGEILYQAASSGLKVKDVTCSGPAVNDYLGAICQADGADVLNVTFHCPQELLRIVYRASDAVLANSTHEPFGLVGLEAMAAEGVAFTGSTGEDYAVPFHNSIVLETTDPREIEAYVLYLREHPVEEIRIRKAAKITASHFTWEEAIQNLVHKLEFQARTQGLLTTEITPLTREKRLIHLETAPQPKPAGSISTLRPVKKLVASGAAAA